MQSARTNTGFQDGSLSVGLILEGDHMSVSVQPNPLPPDVENAGRRLLDALDITGMKMDGAPSGLSVSTSVPLTNEQIDRIVALAFFEWIRNGYAKPPR